MQDKVNVHVTRMVPDPYQAQLDLKVKEASILTVGQAKQFQEDGVFTVASCWLRPSSKNDAGYYYAKTQKIKYYYETYGHREPIKYEKYLGVCPVLTIEDLYRCNYKPGSDIVIKGKNGDIHCTVLDGKSVICNEAQFDVEVNEGWKKSLLKHLMDDWQKTNGIDESVTLEFTKYHKKKKEIELDMTLSPDDIEEVTILSEREYSDNSDVNKVPAPYWLRDSGKDSGCALYVNPEGNVSQSGIEVDTPLAIRPVIRLKDKDTGLRVDDKVTIEYSTGKKVPYTVGYSGDGKILICDELVDIPQKFNDLPEILLKDDPFASVYELSSLRCKVAEWGYENGLTRAPENVKVLPFYQLVTMFTNKDEKIRNEAVEAFRIALSNPELKADSYKKVLTEAKKQLGFLDYMKFKKMVNSFISKKFSKTELQESISDITNAVADSHLKNIEEKLPETEAGQIKDVADKIAETDTPEIEPRSRMYRAFEVIDAAILDIEVLPEGSKLKEILDELETVREMYNRGLDTVETLDAMEGGRLKTVIEKSMPEVQEIIGAIDKYKLMEKTIKASGIGEENLDKAIDILQENLRKCIININNEIKHSVEFNTMMLLSEMPRSIAAGNDMFKGNVAEQYEKIKDDLNVPENDDNSLELA